MKAKSEASTVIITSSRIPKFECVGNTLAWYTTIHVNKIIWTETALWCLMSSEVKSKYSLYIIQGCLAINGYQGIGSTLFQILQTICPQTS